MNSIYYFGVMVRLFAIALFVYSVGRLEFIANYASYSENSLGPSIVFSLLSSVLPMLIAFILWFFPLTVARKILPTTEDESNTTNAQSLLTIAVLVIGVYTFYYAIIDSIYWLTIVHVFVRDEFGTISKVLSNQDKANIVVTVIEFVLALVLLARAKTIGHLLTRFAR